MDYLRFKYPNDPKMSTYVVIDDRYYYYFPYIEPSDRALFEAGLKEIMSDWGLGVD